MIALDIATIAALFFIGLINLWACQWICDGMLNRAIYRRDNKSSRSDRQGYDLPIRRLKSVRLGQYAIVGFCLTICILAPFLPMETSWPLTGGLIVLALSLFVLTRRLLKTVKELGRQYDLPP